MATILYRYAEYKKISTAGADRAKFDTFEDKAQVSPYAQEAMIWATSEEVIRGTGSGIEPKSNATRAQVAQMIMNFALRFNL